MDVNSSRMHALAALISVVLSTGTFAQDVGTLKEFANGAKTDANEVNSNFTSLKNAVNDNHARISTLTNDNASNKTNISDLQTRVTVLETNQCPPDMVANGPGCIDKYEASVWQIVVPATAGSDNIAALNLIAKIKNGTAQLADLSDVRRSPQRGQALDDYDAGGCPDTANGCKNLYAASIVGVIPSRFITWFQALAACRNAGKRLPTNQEWQMAAFGTPDVKITDCALNLAEPSNTGAHTACVSDVGAYDMVGNLHEWVAEWVQGGSPTWAPNYVTQSAIFGGDYVASVNPATYPPNTATHTTRLPAATRRGGAYDHGLDSGVFTVDYNSSPEDSSLVIGFRCAK